MKKIGIPSGMREDIQRFLQSGADDEFANENCPAKYLCKRSSRPSPSSGSKSAQQVAHLVYSCFCCYSVRGPTPDRRVSPRSDPALPRQAGRQAGSWSRVPFPSSCQALPTFTKATEFGFLSSPTHARPSTTTTSSAGNPPPPPPATSERDNSLGLSLSRAQSVRSVCIADGGGLRCSARPSDVFGSSENGGGGGGGGGSWARAYHWLRASS